MTTLAMRFDITCRVALVIGDYRSNKIVLPHAGLCPHNLLLLRRAAAGITAFVRRAEFFSSLLLAMIFREWGRIVRMYERAMEEIIGSAPTLDRLEQLQSDPTLSQRATEVALRVIRSVAKANGQSWRRAAAKSRRARTIYQVLQSELSDSDIQRELHSLLSRNAQLIRSLPAELSQWATAYIARQQQRGRRAQAIEQELAVKLPELTASRLRLIARTEVSKAETAITRVRSE